MGEAALRREFAKSPPVEPLISITALWRDYMRRYVTGRRGDPAIPYTVAAPNLRTAILRACDSKGADGKTFFHQGRVWPINREAYAKELLAAQSKKRVFSRAKTFDEVYEACLKIGKATKGIGVVTIYDVAARICAYRNLEPEHLYFHAGVTEGLRFMGLEIPHDTDRIPRNKLPDFFQDKDLDLVESFLCGYRSEIDRVMRAKRKKARKMKEKSRHSGWSNG